MLSLGRDGSERGRYRGVASVVSTILLVAIVVIVSAVIATFALDLGENVQGSPPESAFVCTDDGAVRHVAGDNIPVDQLEAVGENQVDGDALTAGEAVSVDKLVWKNEETTSLLIECSPTGRLSFNPTIGTFQPPFALRPSLTTPGPMSVAIRDRNGNPFDPADGVDIELTQNPDDDLSILVNGNNQGDLATDLNTSNGTFVDTVELDPGGNLDRGDEYRIEMTASDPDGNEATNVIRITVANYQIQSFDFKDATNNSGASGDDSVTFDLGIKNHADSSEEVTVEMRLYEFQSIPSSPPDLDDYDARTERTVQISQGTSKTFTAADFSDLITDDETIDDGNVYFVYVFVPEPPNLAISGATP